MQNTSKVLIDQRDGKSLLYLPLDKLMHSGKADAPASSKGAAAPPAAPKGAAAAASAEDTAARSHEASPSSRKRESRP